MKLLKKTITLIIGYILWISCITSAAGLLSILVGCASKPIDFSVTAGPSSYQEKAMFFLEGQKRAYKASCPHITKVRQRDHCQGVLKGIDDLLELFK